MDLGEFQELQPGRLVNGVSVQTLDLHTEHEEVHVNLVDIERDRHNGRPGEAHGAGVPDAMLPATIRDFEETARTRYRKRAQELRHNAEATQEVDLDSLRLYIGAISCFPQVSREQEVELAQIIEAGVHARHLIEAGDKQEALHATADELETLAALGDRAHSVLYLANLPLVVSIARKYAEHGDSFPWLDAIQEGNILLDGAIQRFDCTRGVAFNTYAYRHVDFGLKEARAKTTRLMRLPKELYHKAGRLGHKRSELEAETGHEPTAEELALRAELSVDEIRTLLPVHQDVVSLDVILGESQGGNPAGVFVCNRLLEGADAPASESVRQLAAEALDALTHAQRNIVELFYGLGDASGRHTLRDIALAMGYASPETVQSTLNAARLRMRRYFEDRNKPEPAITHDLLKDLGIPDFDALLTKVLDRERDSGYGDEAYRHVLAQRTAIERAIVLLGSDRAAVVNRYYGFGFDKHMAKDEIARELNAPTLRYVEEILRKTRCELSVLIPAVADRSLDLVEWNKQKPNRRNVLVYLARVGMNIADGYSLSDLRVLARRHVNEQAIREDQKEILIKLYGLGEDGATSTTVRLGKEYGRSADAIGRLEGKIVRTPRQH